MGPDICSINIALTRIPSGLYHRIVNHDISESGIISNLFVYQLIPNDSFLTRRRNYRSRICEKPIAIDIDSMEGTCFLAVVIVYGCVNLALNHLTICPIWKTGLGVACVAATAVIVVAEGRDGR